MSERPGQSPTRWGNDAEQRFLWNRLAGERRPVVLYGMGDGADKTLACCAKYGVPVRAVFASDQFVRGQTYRGYPVRTLAQVEAEYGDFVVLLCFATQRPEVLETIRSVARRHTLLVPDLPVCGDTIITPEYLASRREDIQALRGRLADDRSRQVLEDVLAYKLTGEPEYLWRCETPREEVYARLLPPANREIYLDAGAYVGDTVEEFLQAAKGDFQRIIAIEPDRRNFAKLQKLAANLADPRIECLQAGLWDREGTLLSSDASGRGAAIGETGGGRPVQVVSVDHLLGGGPATTIKYDVEGAEEKALRGSAETIRAYRPKLAVAAYHRGGDILDLPFLLHRLCPDYNLYLRHHPYLPAWETNLYAK